jgi:hypothetical protein
MAGIGAANPCFPDNDDVTIELVQPAVQKVIRTALARGETTVPVRDATAIRVNEEDRAWVDSLAGPQPIGIMTEGSRARASGYRGRPISARQAIRTFPSTKLMRA